MDPVSSSNLLSGAQNSSAGTMVMKKAIDSEKQDGQKMAQLLASMPQNAEPDLGKNVDIRA